ncbi:MAG: hypothetical protein IPM46_02405 [Flavobacteriales bacterium]|nr:hypothetical protein [Flavobacteriales bacterium]
MPAKSQDHVHRLIRSMSRAEKRYFKVHLSRNGQEHGSHQDVLFDAIAGMEQYDEATLLTRFSHETFTHHFAITKRRLYEAILRSLESFHAESSVDARINRVLHQVEILHQRALYDDALKALQSARRLAHTHERQPGMLAVMEWEQRLIECRNYADTNEAMLDAQCERGEQMRRGQAELDSLWHIKSRLFKQIYVQGSAREAASLGRLQELIDHPLLRDGVALSTSRARFLHHHIRSAAAFAMGLAEECRSHLHANLSLLERHRTHFQDEPNLILGVVSNLAYVCVQCGRYTEASGLLKKFRSLPGQWDMPETEDLDLKLFATTTSLELSMHLRLGEVDKAMELVPVVERGLKQHAIRIGPVRRASLQYQIAYAHFAAGHADKALRWVNDLLNSLRADDASDVACFTRLLHLLILLELGKKELLPYAIRNTERFLKLNDRAHRFEPRLLRLLKALLRARTKDERDEALRSFHNDAIDILDDPLERGVLEHLDPIAWAESRLSGRLFADAMKERALRMGRAA